MTRNHVDMFKPICEESFELFRQRNAEYGDSIGQTGVLGAVVELIGITARLRQICVLSGDGGLSFDIKNPGKLEDILRDAHNYANIGVMMLAERNFIGRTEK